MKDLTRRDFLGVGVSLGVATSLRVGYTSLGMPSLKESKKKSLEELWKEGGPWLKVRQKISNVRDEKGKVKPEENVLHTGYGYYVVVAPSRSCFDEVNKVLTCDGKGRSLKDDYLDAFYVSSFDPVHLNTVKFSEDEKSSYLIKK